MPDDLDQLIRVAMKTLDEQVPSGYFETLPNQTLARLEGSSMQHGSSGTTTDARDTAVAPPPIKAGPSGPPEPAHGKPIMDQEREEDSGLHDIRNLAQSTKQRLSNRRSTTHPPISDDVLASSSGAFKNIALPQPAAMVSLPAVEDLPSKAEVAAAEKAAKEAAKKAAKEVKEAKSGRISKSEIAVSPVAAPPIETPVVAAVPTRKAFSLPSQQRKSSKGPLLAVLGIGLAAAAGVVIYMQVQKNQESEPASAASEATVAKQDTASVTGAGSAAPAPVVSPIEPAPPPAEVPQAEAAPAGAAELATDDVKAAEDKDANKRKTAPKTTKGGKSKADKEEPTKVEEVKPIEKPEPKKQPVTKSEGGEGEPSFDALLKEAGVDGQKKEAKPKLDKKSLSGDDFKKGMSSPANKAKACYKGTQGTAMVKLTVSPSGAISKLTVSGEFAGKPEASCVESALKSASFPPWDGGPQTFTYSVLLSD
jgi:hypothetical protein